MGIKNIKERLQILLTDNETNRIKIKQTKQFIRLEIDVHEMPCQAVKRLLKNIIAVIRGAFELLVVHGYNRGTAIKSMLAENNLSERIVKKTCVKYNPGITIMEISAA